MSTNTTTTECVVTEQDGMTKTIYTLGNKSFRIDNIIFAPFKHDFSAAIKKWEESPIQDLRVIIRARGDVNFENNGIDVLVDGRVDIFRDWIPLKSSDMRINDPDTIERESFLLGILETRCIAAIEKLNRLHSDSGRQRFIILPEHVFKDLFKNLPAHTAAGAVLPVPDMIATYNGRNIIPVDPEMLMDLLLNNSFQVGKNQYKIRKPTTFNIVNDKSGIHDKVFTAAELLDFFSNPATTGPPPEAQPAKFETITKGMSSRVTDIEYKENAAFWASFELAGINLEKGQVWEHYPSYDRYRIEEVSLKSVFLVPLTPPKTIVRNGHRFTYLGFKETPGK